MRCHRSRHLHLCVRLLALQLLTGTCAASAADEGTVYLLRHGEKQSQKGCLSAAGDTRALLLGKLVVGASPLIRTPSALFAFNYTSDYCQRCVEFLAPLAKALSLPVNDTFGHATGNDAAAAAIRAELAARRKQSSSIVVAWEHHNLAPLAVALGASPTEVPEEWPSDDFDTIFVLTLQADGAVRFATEAEGLTDVVARAAGQQQHRSTQQQQHAAALLEPA